MSPLARPHSGFTVRATGALALGMAMCLVSTPSACADTYYAPDGAGQGVTAYVTPSGGGPTIGGSSPWAYSAATPTTTTADDYEIPGLLTIGRISVSFTMPQSGVLDAAVSLSDVDVPGILTADEIDSRCTTAESGSSGSTTFENLVVGGVAVPADPAADTETSFPNGSARLNGQSGFETNQGYPEPGIAVNALYFQFPPDVATSVSEVSLGQVSCYGFDETTPLPVGALGGVLLTAVLGAVFTVRQLRRRPA